MDKIKLFNEVIKVAKPAGFERPVAKKLSEETVDLGLDSLDTLLITVYLGDIYGVPEEKLKELGPKEIENPDGTKSRSLTISDIFNFMEQNKTQEPASVEEAVEKIK